MTEQSEWTGRVGQSWAEEWRRTDRSFGPLTQRLLEVARADGFAQALDIGCGAGEVSLRLGASDASARVIGVDVSEELVHVARDRTGTLTNVRIELGDAAQWLAGEGERPDLLVSRHGVMFFTDPIAAFAHLRSQSTPNARLVFSCFRERGDNGWAQELASVLPASGEPAPDPRAPGPFAFGEADYVAEILGEAGWRDISLEPIDYAMVAGEGDAAVDDALSYFLRIGPAARALAALPPAERDAAKARLRTLLEDREMDGIVSLPAACWIVTARASG